MSNPMSKERGVYGRVPRGAVSPLEDSPRDAQKRVGKTQETLRLLLRPERGIFLWVRILKSDFWDKVSEVKKGKRPSNTKSCMESKLCFWEPTSSTTNSCTAAVGRTLRWIHSPRERYQVPDRVCTDLSDAGRIPSQSYSTSHATVPHRHWGPWKPKGYGSVSRRWLQTWERERSEWRRMGDGVWYPH